jgi:hypothetical protein
VNADSIDHTVRHDDEYLRFTVAML